MADVVEKDGVALENTDPSQLGKGPVAPKDEGVTKPAEGAGGDGVVPLTKDKAKEPVVEDKKDAPKVEDEPDDESWKEQYIEMPDAAGQSVINLLKAEGIKPVEANAIFEKALKSGNLDDVQWDVLASRLGADKAALARIGIEDHYNKVYKANVAVRDSVHAEVGGEQNWTKITTWAKALEAKDKNFKAELDDIRSAIDAGGRAAKYAARDLKALYEKAPGNNGLGVQKIVEGSQPAPSSEPPLGRAEYMKLMHEADRTNAKPAVIAALRARRQAGMAAGI